MVDFEEISVVLPDRYQAYARWWPVAHPAGAVLYLHGIQSHAGWYAESARRLQQAGFAVMQPDRRGSGRNPQQRGHARDCGQLVDDALCCGQELCRRSGRSAYQVLGISWGGKLACALAGQEHQSVRGVTLVCPGIYPRVGVSPGQKLRIGLSMIAQRHRLHDIPLNDPRLFTDQPAWIEFLRHDPLRLYQVTASFLLASRRLDHMLRSMADAPPRPMHVFLAGRDAIIDAPRTACWVRSLPWEQIRITHYPDSHHTLEFDPVFEAYCRDLIEGLCENDAAAAANPVDRGL